MCLAALSTAQHPRFVRVLASNRDEFHDRAAAPLAWWAPSAGLRMLGGRDLSAGGTWLGLSAAGHLALVTNVREPGRFEPGRASRGDLVPQWLADPSFDLAALRQRAAVPRNGFNLLVADLHSDALAWMNNRPPRALALEAGLVALSNAAIDSPWPKALQLKTRLSQAIATSDTADALVAAALVALADRREAADADLPATGVPLARERQLSPAFIHIPGDGVAPAYGTRCSTVVVVEQTAAGRLVHVHERRWSALAEPAGDTRLRFPLPG